MVLQLEVYGLNLRKKRFLKSLWYILNTLILETRDCYFEELES